MAPDTSTAAPNRLAVSSNHVLHKVVERPYKPGPEWQAHAGDTACGLPVENGIHWSWDIQGHIDPWARSCFFCFGGS